MMKNVLLSFIFLFPFYMFAQKGTIQPEASPKESAVATPSYVAPEDLKIWIVEDKLVKCQDPSGKCYTVNENGIRKTIARKDVSFFNYQEGYKYTVQVKKELKKSTGVQSIEDYKYSVLKIISRKATSISTIYTINQLTDEVEILKVQISELKKQMAVMQQELVMQLQLFNQK